MSSDTSNMDLDQQVWYAQACKKNRGEERLIFLHFRCHFGDVLAKLGVRP